MLVEIKPLPVEKWHKKKGKDSFSQPKTIEVLYNNETGRYDTGLSEEDAEKYGKAMGVDLGDNFNPNEPHPHWSTKAAWISLPNQTLILDTVKNSEFVKVANLKASKYVANSMKEYNEGLWPDATHVIYSEEEEREEKATKFQIEQQVSVKLNGMSLDAKTAIVRVLSKIPIKSNSQNFIDGVIYDLLKEDPNEILRVLNMGKEEVTVRATVLELLQKNILTKQAGKIQYMGEVIALDYEDAIKYFKDPNNMEMKVRLMEKLQK
jgi:hypothetical protein